MDTKLAAGLVVVIAIVLGVVYLVTSGGIQSTYSSTVLTTASNQSTTSVTSTVTTSNNVTTSSNTPTVVADTVNVANGSPGKYLTNSTGFTLYTYGGDTRNSGMSSCIGICAAKWPPFYSAQIVVPSSLNASNFATITRSDRTKQTTYKGWSLYFFVNDKSAGSVQGNHVGGFTVATP